jgi:hypothetical protein
MQPAITVAVIAAAASAVGWIVNYILTSRSERERGRLAAKLVHIERQLELLYGPLAFLAYEGRRSFLDLLDTLGRKYIFLNNEELPQDELELWLFWVDHEFIPRNIAIKNLLSSHTHLVVGDHLPPSYIRFLDHHNSWHIEHQRWKERQIPYSWHSKINWPQEFQDEVIATFEQLMKEHAELIGIIGGTERSSSRTTSLRLHRRRNP